jgi:tetratricopeptide (TPR) repeat protein
VSARVLSLFRNRRLLVASLVGLGVLALVASAGVVFSYHAWAEYHRWQAETAVKRREFDRALANLELCLEVWPRSAETHFLAARAARRAGAYDQAEHHLAVCKRLGWVPEEVALERALVLAQRDDPAGLEEYLLTCVHKDHPDSVIILEALAKGYIRTYQMRRASDCLDLWLQREPDNVQALAWRGEVNERLDHRTDAVNDYRRALELDPQRDEVRLHLAEALYLLQQPEEAVAHYEQLSRHQPGNPDALLGLARCRHEQGRTDEARQLLDRVLTARPHDAGALTERGKMALESGQLPDAETWLRQAVEADSSEREVVYSYWQCLEREGKHEEARPWHERLQRVEADAKRMVAVMHALSAAPRDPELRCEAGQLLLRNGHEDEGLRWLISALEMQPGHRRSHEVLADYFERKGQPEQAAYHRRFAALGPPPHPGQP